MLVARRDFMDKQYIEFNRERLSGCTDGSNFPLALSKQIFRNQHPEQAYYSYPMLAVNNDNKYQQKGIDPQTHSVIITEYYWRFNSTSRFYFELGSQLVNSHLSMKLSVMEGAQVGSSVLSKQRQNAAFIDLDLPAGDYKL